MADPILAQANADLTMVLKNVIESATYKFSPEKFRFEATFGDVEVKICLKRDAVERLTPKKKIDVVENEAMMHDAMMDEISLKTPDTKKIDSSTTSNTSPDNQLQLHDDTRDDLDSDHSPTKSMTEPKNPDFERATIKKQFGNSTASSFRTDHKALFLKSSILGR